MALNKPLTLKDFQNDYQRFVVMHDDIPTRHRAVRNLIAMHYLHIAPQCEAWLTEQNININL